MSILAYAKLTQSREVAPPPSTEGAQETSADHAKQGQPSQAGVSNYADTLAALVPAEVLGLHAFILSFTTTQSKDLTGQLVTKITEPGTLLGVFLALFILPFPIYVIAHCWRGGRYVDKNGAKVWEEGRWMRMDRLDYIRMCIPSIAFLFWTMIQKATAFDPVMDLIRPDFSSASRTAIATIGAAVLGLVATALAKQAEEKPV